MTFKPRPSPFCPHTIIFELRLCVNNDRVNGEGLGSEAISYTYTHVSTGAHTHTHMPASIARARVRTHTSNGVVQWLLAWRPAIYRRDVRLK